MVRRLTAGASRIRTLGPTLSLGPATWVELGASGSARQDRRRHRECPNRRLFASTKLGGQFPGMPGAPSHGQNRGLAVGAADQAPRACDSAHGLTGKERAISRLVAPGSRVTSEPDPTTVSRSAPFIRSEPCVCRRVRGWDLEFESGLLQQRVCEPSVPQRRQAPEGRQVSYSVQAKPPADNPGASPDPLWDNRALRSKRRRLLQPTPILHNI